MKPRNLALLRISNSIILMQIEQNLPALQPTGSFLKEVKRQDLLRSTPLENDVQNYIANG